MTEKKRYRCLIVDDEILARKLISDYVSKMPELELHGVCKSGIEALSVLKKEQIDILFLDINMPDISGIELLRAMGNYPLTILTTAYSNYAVEGFELDVFDYLLKPIPLPRFIGSVNKAIEKLNEERELTERRESLNTEQSTTLDLIKRDYLTVKADHKIYKINFSELVYIEGQREYVTFHTKERKITAFYTLKSLEEQLPSSLFIRIHKSFIVSVKQIRTLDGNTLEVADQKLPIGKSFKQTVLRIFE